MAVEKLPPVLKYTTRHPGLKFDRRGGEVLDTETGEVQLLNHEEYLSIVAREMTADERAYIRAVRAKAFLPRLDPFFGREPTSPRDFNVRMAMFRRWLSDQDIVVQEVQVILETVMAELFERGVLRQEGDKVIFVSPEYRKAHG